MALQRLLSTKACPLVSLSFSWSCAYSSLKCTKRCSYMSHMLPKDECRASTWMVHLGAVCILECSAGKTNFSLSHFTWARLNAKLPWWARSDIGFLICYIPGSTHLSGSIWGTKLDTASFTYCTLEKIIREIMQFTLCFPFWFWHMGSTTFWASCCWHLFSFDMSQTFGAFVAPPCWTMPSWQASCPVFCMMTWIGDGILCANFSTKCGPWTPCLLAWHGKCYWWRVFWWPEMVIT